MDANLTMELREWYIWAVKQFGWNKTVLFERVCGSAHEDIVLPIEKDVCYIEQQKQETNHERVGNTRFKKLKTFALIAKKIQKIKTKEGGRGQWPIRWTM